MGVCRYFDPSKVLSRAELEKVAEMEAQQVARNKQAAARKAAKAASAQRPPVAASVAAAAASPSMIMQHGERY